MGFWKSALGIAGKALGGAGPWGIAAGLAGGLIGSALGGKKKQAAPTPNPTMAAWDQRIAQMGEQGSAVDAEYLQRLRGFNPMQAATQAAQAQYQIAMPQISKAIADLRGAQAGTRLNTGYGQGDQDYLLQQNLNNLNQSMVARAMEAAQMEANTNRELGAYGQNATNMYLDATYGRYQTEEDRRKAEAASKRSMWGSIIGSGLNALGTYAGAKVG